MKTLKEIKKKLVNESEGKHALTQAISLPYALYSSSVKAKISL